MNRNSLHPMPFITVIAILLSALVSVSGRAAPPTVCFTAALDGDQEVPPVATAATGSGNVIYDFESRELSWTFIHDLDMTDVTAAHIHVGAAGVNGPPVITLDHTENPMTGSATLDETEEADLTDHLYYVNVHTDGNPGGEIRGQILRAPGTCFTAALDGDQENPPVTTDATGSGIFTYDFDSRELNWQVIHDLDLSEVTAAHIHVGAVGVNGPIVIPLDHSQNPMVGSETLDEDQEDDLTAELYYVNVHTSANPGGEIRGQMLRGEPDDAFRDRFEEQ